MGILECWWISFRSHESLRARIIYMEGVLSEPGEMCSWGGLGDMYGWGVIDGLVVSSVPTIIAEGNK